MATDLKVEDILKEKNTNNDPNSIDTLTLNHKPLSNVSFLSSFKNLQSLDLKFNALTSLKGVESCISLKSLCVQHNKLQSLKGIEGLINLHVLNAGNNKLTSMSEVKKLLKLRALILNDNEIAIITGLDCLLELNSLILSRNPIRKLGSSLVKLKSVTQISLSNCQLENINDSLKACARLRQLRLAHNDIKTLPMELAHSKELEILDLGNNMISRWSDLEVLSSLHNLRNLNLRGNPISEKVKLIKKVSKLVPSLQMLNSKKIDEMSSEKDQAVKGAPISVRHDEIQLSKKKKQNRDGKHMDQVKLRNDRKPAVDTGLGANACYDDQERPRKSNGMDCNKSLIHEKGNQLEKKNSSKGITCQVSEEEAGVALIDGGENELKKQKKSAKHLVHLEQEAEDEQKKHKQQHLKNEKQEAGLMNDKRNKRKIEKAHIDVINDTETSFINLVSYESTDNMKPSDGQKGGIEDVMNFDKVSALVTYPAKEKKRKTKDASDTLLCFSTPEVGLGGPSAWIDDDK